MTRKLTILLPLTLVPLLGYVVFGAGRLPDGLDASGAPYDVEILRDTWGVPHIFGRTDADAAYGLAFAHAERQRHVQPPKRMRSTAPTTTETASAAANQPISGGRPPRVASSSRAVRGAPQSVDSITPMGTALNLLM
jgi:hypothetical protein